MSCSSRAIRARSSATAMRAAASRSRSAWRARSSAASACSARSRSAKPASQPIANRSGMKMSSPARVARVVVDDDRRAAEHDGQAEPRLHGVAEVAEQERGGHARRRRRWSRTRQPPVDERERRREQPERRGRGERESDGARAAGARRARSPARANHSVVCGASGESCPTATSSALSSAASTISTSNP